MQQGGYDASERSAGDIFKCLLTPYGLLDLHQQIQQRGIIQMGTEQNAPDMHQHCKEADLAELPPNMELRSVLEQSVCTRSPRAKQACSSPGDHDASGPIAASSRSASASALTGSCLAALQRRSKTVNPHTKVCATAKRRAKPTYHTGASGWFVLRKK